MVEVVGTVIVHMYLKYYYITVEYCFRVNLLNGKTNDIVQVLGVLSLVIMHIVIRCIHTRPHTLLAVLD